MFNFVTMQTENEIAIHCLFHILTKQGLIPIKHGTIKND